ncbi:hypothetical protein C8Q76DRAFT_733642 [Earliella scabrosa]|nr:hypothetical protein C8Q76DRAFT_733642 [Earliella scabrosa]
MTHPAPPGVAAILTRCPFPSLFVDGIIRRICARCGDLHARRRPPNKQSRGAVVLRFKLHRSVR